ncbi:MAG TPA: hypothetical protein ENN29_11955, partial [Candidatus Hydrogenedentes bacterium]|nr:hypothetical protein [Candidatus Hydrogenedentota bacterium]
MALTVETTQRAYTMRLTGDSDNTHWRELLWKTHELTNRGAHAFGDFLLTMRGGLSHELATGNTSEETRTRRIILAMSWLSVESKEGSPQQFHVPQNWEGKKQLGQYKVLEALESILTKRGLDRKEIEAWINDCTASLQARIRDDAVWVNRSECFDAFCKEAGVSVNRASAKNNLFFFISEDQYFLLKDIGEESANVPDSNSLNLVQLARKWLSNYWGAGIGNDKRSIKDSLTTIAGLDYGHMFDRSGTDLLNYIAVKLRFGEVEGDWDLRRLKSCIGWRSGRSSSAAMALEKIAAEKNISKEAVERFVEKCADEAKTIKVPDKESQDTQTWNENIRGQLERAIGVPYRDEKDHIDEFSVMLDHGARHVSVAHSWMLLQEGKRIEFSKDAQKLNKVPEEARQYLDEYCELRTELTSAVGDYVIRKRAIEGWKEVVKAWSASDCRTPEDYVEAARQAQAEDVEGGKFGDINLFEALAEEDACCVWRNDKGKPDADILKNYVEARWAETQMKRFKVPMYRHPDALRHPVYCDFGSSRFSIDYAALRAKKDVPVNSLTLTVYDGASFKPLTLRWQSKRLMKDIIDLRPKDNKDGDAIVVSRADRLGRAAGGAGDVKKGLTIATVFDEKKWNGRLQVSRRQLDNLERKLMKAGVPDKDRCKTVQSHLPNLDWFITFSPKLSPQGPWIDYAMENKLKVNAKNIFNWRQRFEPKKRGTLTYAPLCRLPDLRVLSVDLGHRYAASCAVMQTMSTKQLCALCEDAGATPPAGDALYFVLSEQNGEKPKKKWFRRIGPDRLPDGAEHPAPWAMIERQFTIKLDGEDDTVRGARKEEIKNAVGFCENIGIDENDLPKNAVDELMGFCVRQYRLALRRHSDVARIAFAMTAQHRHGMGGRKETLDSSGILEEKTKALLLWDNLRNGRGKAKETAERIWGNYLAVHVDRLG